MFFDFFFCNEIKALSLDQFWLFRFPAFCIETTRSAKTRRRRFFLRESAIILRAMFSRWSTLRHARRTRQEHACRQANVTDERAVFFFCRLSPFFF